MKEIETERLKLRPMRLSDSADLFAVFGNADVMKYWSSGPHKSESDTRALIKATISADPATTQDFAIEFQGRVIGKAGFWRMPEIGYLLHSEFWGRGIGTEALRAVIDHGFAECGLARITADVDPDNAASLGMLAKLGFTETGRAENTIEIDGKWYDSIYLELRAPS